MKHTILRALAVGAVATLVAASIGCGNSNPPPATDGGAATDGGGQTDGGNNTDGGPHTDGGPRTDGGAGDGGPGLQENEADGSFTNDDTASAVTLPLGQVIAGFIGTADGNTTDVDFYKFTGVAGKVYRVTLGATGDFQPIAGIRDTDGNLIRLVSAPAAATQATRQFYASKSGDYYVQVLDARNAQQTPEGVGGPNVSYNLQVSEETVTPTPLTLPALNQNLTISDTNEVKIFSFTATAGQGYLAETRAARLNPASSVDTFLALMDARGATPVEVVTNDDISQSVVDSQVRKVLTDAGTYHVVLDFYGINFSDATVNRAVQLDVRNYDPGIELEPNDSRASANTIAAPVTGTPTNITGVINGAAGVDGGAAAPDLDFFKVTLPAGTYLEILATKPTGSNAAFVPYLAFMNSGGSVTFANPNVPANSPTRLEAYAFTAGDYYVIITDRANVMGDTTAGGADFTYNLRLSVITRTVASLGDAPVAASMAGAVDQGGKTAWFSFNVPAGNQKVWWLDLDLSGTPNGLALEPFIVLYDSTNAAIAGGSRVMIRDAELAPGAYTLAVTDANGAFSSTSHSFKPRVVSVGEYTPITDDGSHTTQGAALAISGNRAIVDSVLPASGQVWYALGNLTAGSAITVRTSRSPALPAGPDGGAPQDVDTILTLTDASGTTVTSNDDGSSGVYSELVGYAIPTTGNYFVKITGYAPSMGTPASGPFRFLALKGTCSSTGAAKGYINEIFAAPGSSAGDANGDGATNAVTDEFVELVNLGRVASDLSEVLVRDASGVRYRAACGTTVAAGSSLVVFGGCASGTCTAGKAQANATPASPGGAASAPEGLGLDDTGDMVMLIGRNGETLDRVSFAAATAGTSFARGASGTCDVRPATQTVGVQLHTACTGAAGRKFSPGVKADNTAFAPPPALTNDTCAAATALTSGVLLTGQDTSTFANDYDPGEDSTNCGGLFGGPLYTGKDAAFKISVPAGKTLRVTATPVDNWDLAVALITDCAAAPMSCQTAADSSGAGAAETAVWQNTGSSAQMIYVIVDSAIDASFGEFNIRADLN